MVYPLKDQEAQCKLHSIYMTFTSFIKSKSQFLNTHGVEVYLVLYLMSMNVTFVIIILNMYLYPKAPMSCP